MTRTELITETRAVVDDTIAPYGWTTNRLLNWLAEGQDKFCEQTGYFADKATYFVTTVLGQQDYPLSPRIVAVRSVWDGARQLIDGAGATFSDADFSDNAPQAPVHYRTDLVAGYITLFEPVQAGLTLSLRVHRRSKVSLKTAEPEVPEEFHLALVEYAAYKAFGNHDKELQDPIKAREHYENFRQYVKDGSRAYRRITGEYTDVAPSPLYVV